MINKRQARITALQSLFQEEFADQAGSPAFTHDKEPSPESAKYASYLIDGVRTRLVEIDQLIESHSRNWKIQRMAFVDKNILRIAIFEICFASEPVPVKAAINEAIELAKKFGGNDSRAFINGILDQIANRVDPSLPSG
jgi:N utilization substance protein B